MADRPPTDPPWYVEAFGGDYLARYAHRDEDAARREVPFLVRALEAHGARGGRVLDLCCGAGRYARGLREAGLAVVGADLSLALLRCGAAQPGAPPSVRADMRALPFASGAFDAVVNLFTSFGYFEDEAENRRALGEAARVLRPGGVLLLDFLNLPHTLANLAPSSERAAGGETLVETRRYDPARGRIEKAIAVLDAASRAEKRRMVESVRAYAPDELAGLFAETGLSVRARFGSLLGEAYAENTSRCVLVGVKG
ncbi:MAG: class I SAM-dependent methyltransferase [Planctomycetota bacterium]|nr:class I SAM-dependent methyltransferase [Planctomycetota bacterium]